MKNEVDFLKEIIMEFNTARFGEGMSVNLKCMSNSIQIRIDELKKEQSTPGDRNSEIKIRIKVQDILQKNTRTPIGMFHGKELNERGFVNNLLKNFNISFKK